MSSRSTSRGVESAASIVGFRNLDSSIAFKSSLLFNTAAKNSGDELLPANPGRPNWPARLARPPRTLAEFVVATSGVKVVLAV